MISVRKVAAIALAALALPGCGFTPLYATPSVGSGRSSPGLSNVAIAGLDAPDSVKPLVERAFNRRVAATSSEASYDLTVKATETAERLAVQIDASVTRYNYRLVGAYTLTERASGKRYQGSITSIASFNVVNSQYSTLFAEKAAREKAATSLVEDIERDILLKIASERDPK